MQIRDHRSIARLMSLQGISQRELAETLGLKAHSYVSRIVHGQVRSVSATMAAKIAHALDMPVDSLFLTRVSTKSGQKRDAA